MNEQPGNANRSLSVAALAAAGMFFVMRMQGRPLTGPESPRGIVDLEFASQPQWLQQLLAHWDPSVVKMNIWLDFAFIVTYVLFFSLASGITAMQWPAQSFFRRAGLFCARIAFVAGVFDIAENLLMLQSVNGNFSSVSLQLTCYTAMAKFLLLLLVVVYLLVSLPVIFKKK